MVCSITDGGRAAAVGPYTSQEVRTLMTVTAVGVAHNRKSIVPTPVAAG